MTRSIAYLSMEIGIKPEIKSYSGGLGILAGDTLKSAADLGEDMIGITLLYHDGYFAQKLEDGQQTEAPEEWNPEDVLEKTDLECSVRIFGEECRVIAWRYRIESRSDVDVYFLDAQVDENSQQVQELNSMLYGGDDRTRLGQEVLLGIGGMKLIRQLDQFEPNVVHLNEGHSALSTLEKRHEKFVFTTHTPIAAGHDHFNQHLVEDVLPDRSHELDLSDGLNMTVQALNHSEYTNTVSLKHKDVTEDMFPGYTFSSITNGVHSETWTAEPFRNLFDQHLPNWRNDAARLSQAMKIPNHELWEAKQASKTELAQLIETRTGRTLDTNLLTVGYARRMTGYKRPTLVFKDLEALENLGETYEGLQLIFAGKAHPRDTHGKELIQQILSYREMLNHVDVYYLENYSAYDALQMVSGCDVWLNNPTRHEEASGTSGMKAAHNGTPQLSVRDGWWIEGHIEDVTGWSIGESYVEGEDENEVDARSLYHKLDHILSLYQNDRSQWLEIMKNGITANASYFNTDRMVREYITEAYDIRPDEENEQ